MSVKVKGKMRKFLWPAFNAIIKHAFRAKDLPRGITEDDIPQDIVDEYVKSCTVTEGLSRRMVADFSNRYGILPISVLRHTSIPFVPRLPR